MKFLLSLSLVFSASLLFFSMPSVLAEGGGGIDCPASSDKYNFLSGSAVYTEDPFEQGTIALLTCEYMTDVLEEGELDLFGDIKAIFHLKGELSSELIDEYGCGNVLGEQYSPTYVSSTTHFASVAFSIPALLEASAEIMTQIEEQNLATPCEVSGDIEGGSTAESVKETVEEHEVIEDSSIEVSIEEINEETIEIIKEKIEQGQKIDKPKPQVLKIGVVLPDWIKNNAGWWASDQITNDDFSLGIEFMISNGYIKLPPTEVTTETSSEIPDWVKLNAGWWAEAAISDDEFVNGLQFLISNGIISVA